MSWWEAENNGETENKIARRPQQTEVFGLVESARRLSFSYSRLTAQTSYCLDPTVAMAC